MSLATTIIALKARISARPFQKAVRDPVGTQQRLLRSILERNKDTEYGRAFHFASLKSLEDYQGNVPIIDYEDIRERIDRMTRGESNILTAEKPVLFAQTSGTTGDPKYIPVTPTCQKGGGTTTWLHFARTDHPEMFAGKIITIVSPAIEGYTPSGIPFGSTSGMVIRELPPIVQSVYAVPYEVYEVEDYDAKYY
ncbi:MAG: GH3 auxin-responsive promoter family protein, partial [Akkermansiaceae bacterium]|nr:GH3 auxin-responsive promoter family protein [Akkermansiaceae bacterium]